MFIDQVLGYITVYQPWKFLKWLCIFLQTETEIDTSEWCMSVFWLNIPFTLTGTGTQTWWVCQITSYIWKDDWWHTATVAGPDSSGLCWGLVQWGRLQIWWTDSRPKVNLHVLKLCGVGFSLESLCFYSTDQDIPHFFKSWRFITIFTKSY